MDILNHTVALKDSHYVQILMLFLCACRWDLCFDLWLLHWMGGHCWHLIVKLGYSTWPHLEVLVVGAKLACPITGSVLSNHFY